MFLLSTLPFHLIPYRTKSRKAATSVQILFSALLLSPTPATRPAILLDWLAVTVSGEQYTIHAALHNVFHIPLTSY
jgi:hypothetical protein